MRAKICAAMSHPGRAILANHGIKSEITISGDEIKKRKERHKKPPTATHFRNEHSKWWLLIGGAFPSNKVHTPGRRKSKHG